MRGWRGGRRGPHVELLIGAGPFGPIGLRPAATRESSPKKRNAFSELVHSARALTLHLEVGAGRKEGLELVAAQGRRARELCATGGLKNLSRPAHVIVMPVRDDEQLHGGTDVDPNRTKVFETHRSSRLRAGINDRPLTGPEVHYDALPDARPEERDFELVGPWCGQVR